MKVFVCVLETDGCTVNPDSVFIFTQKQQAELWKKIWEHAFSDDNPIVLEREIEAPFK